jgi:hypothetical protein
MPRLSKIGAAALAAFGWTSGSTVTASYLQVAGGGSGGAAGGWTNYGPGGGGAGGYLTGTTSLNPTQSYTVVVGAGGAGSIATSTQAFSGTQGSNSQFGTLTASVGGGYGACGISNSPVNGGNGGSGGGGWSGSVGVGSGGTATLGQGNNGGATLNAGPGGGGGGAGAVGATSTSGVGGAGGIGLSNSISGTATYYAGGGGAGASNSNTLGVGGNGGGGSGGVYQGNGVAGTANLGAGGGGSGAGNSATTVISGNGGSGVVIISYLSPQKFGGGIVTTSGSNTIHTFTTSGTLSPLSSLTASALVVAGGGAGGGSGSGKAGGGGGGAGGFRSITGIGIDTNSNYIVTVGAGGTGVSAANGTSGANSSFFTVSSTGGGYGSYEGNSSANGGSGGGSGWSSGTAGTGNAGGYSPAEGTNGVLGNGNGGGGGGGATSAGGSPIGSSGGTGGAGGNGTASSFSGTSITYAGGGGGGMYNGGSGGAGGTGGGGSGNTNSGSGTAGTANLGAGGGGGGGGISTGATLGGNGGSGIVIISYAGSVQQMAGGTVTISGGNVIHTFTSSGYLTPLKYVGNSLRFRSNNNSYLSRTPSVASNQKTWTFSAWIKIGNLSTSPCIFSGGSGTGSRLMLYFNTNGQLLTDIQGVGTGVTTTSVFRDYSAWYHVVWVTDTTNATANNRSIIYINNVLQPITVSNALSLNTNYGINGNVIQCIGELSNSVTNSPYDGYMTEINFIDGQALTPNSFGTFNSYGVWQPITYGGSYGTNGFYLPFTATQSYAGSFSGSSQWVSVPNLSAYSVGTSNYTVEGWFYFNSLPSSQGLFGCDNGSGSTAKFLGTVLSNGSVALDFTNSGGASFLVSSTGVVTTGKWYHIAYVRNSGTTTIYVNGTSVGSTSSSVNLAGLTQAWNIGYIGEAGPSSLNGYASNFRLVTGTAVYTSNFVPQTTPLTAISGTQILTLQNTTLVDNSTNAQTVTNTGGVTVGGNYPFAIIGGTVKDFGPAGNNWTANNIGQINGSTLDTMTDVPTLTSTTAANYAVLNPLSTTSTLANGNLTYSSGASWAQGTLFATSGKFYVELVATGTFSAQGISFGISSATANLLNSAQPGVTSPNGCWEVYSGGGLLSVWSDTTYTNQTNPFTVGSTWQIAIDATNGYCWLGQNNTWYSSTMATTGNPSTGANPTFTMTNLLTRGGFSVLVGNNTAGGTFNINAGQQPFVYTAPTGFLPLNTYNL